MNPPLVDEMLAAVHQRELVEDAARERIAAVPITRGEHWRVPIATVLRRFEAALVVPRDSVEEFSPTWQSSTTLKRARG